MILPALLMALALQTAQTTPPVADGQEVVVRSSNRPSPQTPATMVVEPVAMFIAACDADGDGVTASAELDACVARSFAAIDIGGTGRLRYLAYADWAARYLGDANALPSPFDVDRDTDDQVTLDELQRQFAKLYTRFDKDGRPGISRAELLTFRTAPVDANGPARSGVSKKGKR
ncbi:EF-hand domain-containing protein [Sphingomonas rubra]|uniref:EF hand n=1 Tax=Sphingomonas rubra TaxID=634430 RepID=A0A1I5QI86_9SPHN|nr:EF-hand domain-containing protein [Sphingomonas rubra]SFP45781.1 hypothetical protein SAMN04488241_10256 [Sphingomonas rubra]